VIIARLWRNQDTLLVYNTLNIVTIYYCTHMVNLRLEYPGKLTVCSMLPWNRIQVINWVSPHYIYWHVLAVKDTVEQWMCVTLSCHMNFGRTVLPNIRRRTKTLHVLFISGFAITLSPILYVCYFYKTVVIG
jgi:hypothetical protein